jgi:hypothetical protein
VHAAGDERNERAAHLQASGDEADAAALARVFADLFA